MSSAELNSTGPKPMSRLPTEPMAFVVLATAASWGNLVVADDTEVKVVVLGDSYAFSMPAV